MRIERRAEDTSAESWSDAELLQRMRHDEALAIREFYRRFTPALWKVARQEHVQPALREDLVMECLADTAMHLMQPTARLPANLTGYLITTFRHRLTNDRRATKRRAAYGAAAAWAGDGERVVRQVVSEASIRASDGPAAETPPLSPVLERLSRVIDADVSDEERQILRWVSAGIPQRLIAEWLGITHNAARVRVLRLRERLIELALRDDSPRRAGEREELYEFFRRSGLSERARRLIEGSQQRSGSARSRPNAGRKPREEGEDQ